ncbi:MAG: molybdopterin oxidoreductase [Thermoproteus sp. JCHS_4]|jgi:Fe-S-cluster-containing dehydrogenase component|nr:MAG: molybdopterin oxidoreductase [Thermoproteus sp. JCHS_4]
MTRLAFLWDQSRCISCGACIAACNAANYGSSTAPNVSWNWLRTNIRRIELSNGPRPMLYLLQCQHCENPPCVTVCPTGASYRDRDGLVKINYDLCIGCRYCMVACPYDARWFNESMWAPVKCMGEECQARIAKGEQPVCVAVCPAGARGFGDLDDPGSSISRRLAESRYVKLLDNMGTRPKYFVVVGP